ncbi:MAG TPA: MarR family transcriptional regulator [Bacillota bacterium]|nr:MarR family transcriptional regulator [Bacillota bacterium]
MTNNNIAEQINQTIEDIWMLLEQTERAYMSVTLNNQQHVLLTLIIRHPSSSPTELAEKMNITKSAVSQQLAKLEKEGYIMRKPHAEDKRTISIELDDKGRLYKEKMDIFRQHVAEKYQAHLSPAELANMLSVLQKLQALLEKQ